MCYRNLLIPRINLERKNGLFRLLLYTIQISLLQVYLILRIGNKVGSYSSGINFYTMKENKYEIERIHQTQYVYCSMNIMKNVSLDLSMDYVFPKTLVLFVLQLVKNIVWDVGGEIVRLPMEF